MIKKFNQYIKENYNNSAKFKKGDLVFNKNLGNRGLVGLVFSDPKNISDEFGDYTEYDVYYRGYGGDILPENEDDINDLLDSEVYINSNIKDDINIYKLIASENNISINPKYDQLINLTDDDDFRDDNDDDIEDSIQEPVIEKLKFKINRVLERSGKIKLSDDEKNFLWSKLEFSKKKKAVEGTVLYKLLKGDQTSFSDDEFSTILKALEFNFRKKLVDGDLKGKSSGHFSSIKGKLSSDHIPVKQSNLKVHKKKEDKKEEEKKSEPKEKTKAKKGDK